MTTKALLFIALSTCCTAPAFADEWAFDASMPVAGKLDIAFGGGYFEAGGQSGVSGDLRDLAGPGGNVELHVGYRVRPWLTNGLHVSVEGYTGGELYADTKNDGRGFAIGTESTFHFRPRNAVDPWLALGGGMRFLTIERDGEEIRLRGLDLVRVQVGVDYRITPSFSIAPSLAATATVYTKADTSMTSGFTSIDDKELSWTFGAGLLGRFNL